VPEVPDVPDVPSIPLVPEVPEVPDVPDVPSTPLVPEVPDVPEVPEVPDVPAEPSVPDAPDVPDEPCTPAILLLSNLLFAEFQTTTSSAEPDIKFPKNTLPLTPKLPLIVRDALILLSLFTCKNDAVFTPSAFKA
jgi:hypothetical protein